MNPINTATHDCLVLAAYLTAALDELGVGCVGVGVVETEGGTHSTYARMDIEPYIGGDSWRIVVGVLSSDNKTMSVTGSGIPNGIEHYYINGSPSLHAAARRLCTDFSDAYRAYAKEQMAEARKMLERYGKLAEE